jgi:ABC-type branched-subunit amino acid transport system substrate-binding protein
MIPRRPSPVLASLCAIGAFALTGCSQVSPQSSSTAGTSGAITIGPGVTKEPCPKAVNKSNGCIYLGVLSDLSQGPFAALAVQVVQAQRNYWAKVNEAGGISGYEVDLETNTKDTKFQAAEHAAAYQQIKGNILALAQTLGTVNTAAILPDMDTNNIVGVPASWWSGYNFTENDKGLILEVGYSYCTEAMVGLDWYTEKNSKPASIAAVGYPGDYGGDSAAGVKEWASINGVSTVTVIPTGPNQVRGNQDAVVAAVKAANPSVVVLAVGPAENAEIIGKLVAGGYPGRFMGSLPTWNPALLKSAAADAIVAKYNHMSPTEQWDGTSAGVTAMKAAAGNTVPTNLGYVGGWAMNYPMHAVLDKAAKSGNLTRAGVRKAVEGLSVTFDGMAPTVTYGGDGKSVASSGMIVSTPDKTAPLGLTATGGFYQGTTFEEAPYTKACSATS